MALQVCKQKLSDNSLLFNVPFGNFSIIFRSVHHQFGPAKSKAMLCADQEGIFVMLHLMRNGASVLWFHMNFMGYLGYILSRIQMVQKLFNSKGQQYLKRNRYGQFIFHSTKNTFGFNKPHNLHIISRKSLFPRKRPIPENGSKLI